MNKQERQTICYTEAYALINKIENTEQYKEFYDLMQPVFEAVWNRNTYVYEDWFDLPYFNVSMHRLVAEVTLLKNENYLKYIFIINELIKMSADRIYKMYPNEMARLKELELEIREFGSLTHPIEEYLMYLGMFNSIVMDFQENGEAVWDPEVIM